MRKKSMLLVIIMLCLIVFSYASKQYQQANVPPTTPAQTIALIPLDSRPCNTQYPQLLAQMAGYTLLLPPQDALDDFLTPSHETQLWQWLENAAANSDHLIIFTNELFNGGLIASRDSHRYSHIATQLEMLSDFSQRHSDREITVISILPRLKPSQFDDFLWPYEVELTLWGQALDQAAYHHEPMPALPQGVPTEVGEAYLALYAQSQLLADSLADLAANGAIDRVVIGQDDAETWCPSNTIYRSLESRQSENLTLIHGADELTMLLVADMTNPLPPLEVRLLYTDSSRLGDYYPYEAADLSTIVSDKLALAGLVENANAPYTIIIHNDAAASEEVGALMATLPEGSYLGIADIAYTNKGDTALQPLLMNPATNDRINCYAGWNTASNSIGTVLAHARVSQLLAEDYAWKNSDHRKSALSALHTFKHTRLVEDMIYQGLLSNELRMDLQAWDWMSYNNTFLDNRRSEAQSILWQRYQPYQNEVELLFNGAHTLHLNDNMITYHVDDFKSMISFPWNRAFEIYAQCQFELQP